MTKTKFTSGEWMFKKHSAINEMWVETNVEPICRVENRNDGHLIEQAPEMYAELEMIAANLPIINKHLPMNVVGVEGMISRINALLSAARGETTKP